MSRTIRRWATLGGGVLAVAVCTTPSLAGKDDLPPVQSVAVGDFDGDGTPDVAVGLPEVKVGKLRKAGEVRIYSGKTGKFVAAIGGRLREEEYGGAMAAIGDVDGDGATDLAIGSPWSDKGARVDFVSGKTLKVHHVFPGGSAIAIGTDVVAIGDGSGASTVPVILQDGVSRRWYVTAADRASLDGREHDAGNATTAAWVGDVNGDGDPDFALSDFPTSRIRILSTKALRTGDGPRELWTAWKPGQGLGLHVGPAGDWNGDGKADVLCGIPGDSRLKGASWRVRVLSGVDGADLWERSGAEGDVSIGGAVLMDDLDGDGARDVATSHPGREKNAGAVQVISAKEEKALWTLAGAKKEMLGEDIYPSPDVDGDGVRDLVLVSPGAKLERKKGNGYVRFVSGKTGVTITVINPLKKK